MRKLPKPLEKGQFHPYKPFLMKNDRLKQFVALRESLVNEKAALEARLMQINKALGGFNGAGASHSPASPTRTRAKNAFSLKEAITKVTTAKPLTKPEIMAGLKKLGYRFTAKDPTNSVNVVLYTKGNFKNQGGKFSPLK